MCPRVGSGRSSPPAMSQWTHLYTKIVRGELPESLSSGQRGERSALRLISPSTKRVSEQTRCEAVTPSVSRERFSNEEATFSPFPPGNLV